MTKLRTRMWRDLWRMKWRVVAIVLTIASAVGVHVGMYSGLRSLFWTRDSIYRELSLADLDVHFVPEDVNNFPSLSGLEGVEAIERRLVFPGILQTRGETLSAELIFLETPVPRLDRLRFLAGRPFRDDAFDEVVIEQGLAEYHGYGLGDRIAVKVGEAVYEGRVVGIVLSPEYLVATSNPDYYVPEKGSLGVVYGNLKGVSDSLGFTIVNDLLFGYAAGADPDVVKREILRRIDKLDVDQAVARERQFGFKYIQTQLTAISHFVPAMVVLLLVLASVITSINFSRLIATERREIGALLALGYSRQALVRSYLEGALVLGLLGGAAGLGFSYFVRDLFATICASSMGMPVVRTLSFPGLMARGFVYGLLVTCGSAVLPTLRLLRLPLHEILRETHRLVQRGRWRSRLSLLPSSYRYGIRNLLRQRGRAWATLASIALALGVASAYRISARSIDETLTRRFENDRWHLSVGFQYPVYLDEAEGLQTTAGVESMTPYLRHYAELESGGRYADAVVFGVDAEKKMTAPPFVEGGEARRADEITVSAGLAKKLDVGVGDVVSAEVRGRSRSFTVSGVTTDVVTDMATMPLADAQELFELPDKVSGAQFRVDGPDDAVETALLERDFVGKIFRKSQFLAQMRGVLEVMIRVLDLAAVINIGIGILFVLTSINLSVLETEGEFATLKAIGYGDGAVGRIVLTETLALAVGAALLSVPLGELVSVYLNGRLGDAWFRVDNFLLPMEFAKVVVPALLFIPLGVYPGLRHVLRLDVSTVLRTRTIE